MKISVIIPVYNEQATILSILGKVMAVPLPQGINKEIIVIDDGSVDLSRAKLKEAENLYTIKVLFHDRNLGKGCAVMTGINQASGDIILIQDADLEYDPSNFPGLLKPLLAGQATIVYGSRFQGVIKNMTFINRMANLLSNWTLNVLYGCSISDVNTCYKVFRKEILEDIAIHSRGFDFETEFTAKVLRKGHTIMEIPIRYQARDNKHGKKMNWTRALKMYGAMIKYRFGPLK